MRPTSYKNVLPLVFLCLVAGCATGPKQETGGVDKSGKDEYEWVTVTGSRIPVKVRKVRSASGTAAERDREDLRSIQDRSNTAKFPEGSN